MRPVVDRADRHYELRVRRPHEATAVVVDGEHLQVLQQEDRVSIRPSQSTFKLIEIAGHTYYRTLREKLGWGGRLRQITED